MPNAKSALELEILPDDLSVYRLAPESPCPQNPGGALFSITYTADELSVLGKTSSVPDNVTAEHGFVAIKVAGPLDFALIGILADLTASLAAADISVFVISTFDTDYVLCKRVQLPAAIETLTDSGHRFTN